MRVVNLLPMRVTPGGFCSLRVLGSRTWPWECERTTQGDEKRVLGKGLRFSGGPHCDRNHNFGDLGTLGFWAARGMDIPTS
eukprot:4509211-Pyramimonas_sp.AAC.1